MGIALWEQYLDKLACYCPLAFVYCTDDTPLPWLASWHDGFDSTPPVKYIRTSQEHEEAANYLARTYAQAIKQGGLKPYTFLNLPAGLSPTVLSTTL